MLFCINLVCFINVITFDSLSQGSLSRYIYAQVSKNLIRSYRDFDIHNSIGII